MTWRIRTCEPGRFEREGEAFSGELVKVWKTDQSGASNLSVIRVPRSRSHVRLDALRDPLGRLLRRIASEARVSHLRFQFSVAREPADHGVVEKPYNDGIAVISALLPLLL